MGHELLEQLPIYARLNSEEIKLFEKFGILRSIQKGEFLFKEGDPGRSFWVVLSGKIGIYKIWGDGREKLLRTSLPGDFIGELSIVRQNHFRSATAIAEEEVHVLEVATADLEQLLRKQSNLALPLLRDAFFRFMQTEEAAFQDLMDKNERLTHSLIELKAAQAQLIQQEKLEHELAMARRIQETFLPHQLPELPGWEIAVHWQPAREVSGDFYDFVPLSDGRTAVVVGDVSGKGIPAALIMAVTRSILRTALRQGGGPGELLRRINEALVEEMPPSMFVTAFLALVDIPNGEIRFANAGHCLPVVSWQGNTSELIARGMPLGLMPEMNYEEGIITLPIGGFILFYSDALLEAHNPGRELFGKERLHETVHSLKQDGAASHLIEQLLTNQVEFTGQDVEQEDDLTLILLQRKTLESVIPITTDTLHSQQ